MRIGIDFDNTIATYDDAMHRWALNQGFISADTPKNKKLIRDAIRALDDGETKWRTLQVYSYGPGMVEAQVMPGFREFLQQAQAQGVPISVVSHKTEVANFGDPGVKLREAALMWLAEQELLGDGPCRIDRQHIYFEETREAKIQRIRSLNLTHFIDDLEETFLEASFPRQVSQILITAEPSGDSTGCWQWQPGWHAIQRELFGA